MKFIERTEQLREGCQMSQRQFAAVSEIDTVACCKLEDGKRSVEAERIVMIVDLLQTDEDE